MYRVILKPAAEKFFEKLRNADLQRRIASRLRELAANPRTPGAEKLSGGDVLYRIRVGDYRIVYQIRDAELLVLVAKIADRKDVYR